jgi:hypothetical protein
MLSDTQESSAHCFHFDLRGKVLQEVKPFVFRTLAEQSGLSESDQSEATIILSGHSPDWGELRSLVSRNTRDSGRIIITAEHFDQVRNNSSDAAFAAFEATFLLPLIESREGRFHEQPVSVFLAERVKPRFRQFEVRRRVHVCELGPLAAANYAEGTYAHTLAVIADKYGLPTAQGFELVENYLSQVGFDSTLDKSNQLSEFLRREFFGLSGLIEFMADFVPSWFPREQVYKTTISALDGINSSFREQVEPVGIERFRRQLAPFYENGRVSQSTAYLFCRGLVAKFPTLVGWDDLRGEYVLRPFLSNFLTKTQHVSDK